jgi:hypothetical protein
LAANTREDKKRTFQRRNCYQKPVECCKKAPAPINRGGFAALDVDFDEEITCVKRKFSEPSGPKPVSDAILAQTQTPFQNKPSFASVLLKPVAPVATANKPMNLCGFSVFTKDGVTPPVVEKKPRISWADYDDYSDEEEEEEELECTDSWDL